MRAIHDIFRREPYTIRGKTLFKTGEVDHEEGWTQRRSPQAADRHSADDLGKHRKAGMLEVRKGKMKKQKKRS